jgi:predicted methyltransferase
MTSRDNNSVILSHFEAKALITARKQAKVETDSTPDLGITRVTVRLAESGVAWPNGTILSWDHTAIIADNTNACFRVSDTEIVAIKGYSDFTGRSFSLMPTGTAPAMIVAGFPMHRIKDIDPLSAARLMIDAIGPLRGRVLDTATGLGYTAIAAATTAQQVFTIEFDPTAEEMACANPWSRALFDNAKISLVKGDASELISTFKPGEFDCIIHDPPAQCLAGDLYSGAFYKQAFRVLSLRGRMFHYIGNPESQSGSRTTKGVVRRLMEAGFARVEPRSKAFGVAAFK